MSKSIPNISPIILVILDFFLFFGELLGRDIFFFLFEFFELEFEGVLGSSSSSESKESSVDIS
jgi:hypothetical protein